MATGALTNVGALFRKYPELIAHIKGLSLMGGSFGGGFSDAPLGMVDGKPRVGNYTPWAEFNILVDPEAAATVFHTQEIAAKTVVVPLDLSHQVLATPEVREMLLYGPTGEKSGPGRTALRTMLVELLYFFAQTYASVPQLPNFVRYRKLTHRSDTFGITAGPPLHDPLAVAAVLIGTQAEIPFFEYDARKGDTADVKERFKVTVITEGTFEEAQVGKQTGRTLAELLPAGEEGVRIPRGLDVAKFWEEIERCVERADVTNAGLDV